MKKAIIHARIYDFHDYFEDGYILFDDSILAVGNMSEYVNHGEVTMDAKGCLVLPSLVCGHAHIYSTFARGMSVPFNPKNFQQILDQLWWKMDRHIDNEITYYSGLVAASEFIQNGVTTIIDHHASGQEITGSLEALKKSVCDIAGLRAVFAFEVSDRFDVTKAIAENRNFIEKYHTPFTAGLFGLHASMSLSEKTLEKVHQALGDAPIHIHVAESPMDQADCQTKYHERIVHRLDRHGLLNPKSLLVHAIDVDAGELNLMAKRGCTIAVNVSSNMNNAVGLPNLAAFRAHGVRVILGNDGLSSGMAGDILATYYSAHLRDESPTHLNLSGILMMIHDTYDYASEILGIKLGHLQAGFEADFLMLPYTPPTPMNAGNAFGHVFFGLLHAFKPQHVWVAGKRILKDYSLTNKDLSEHVKHAPKIAEKLWKEIRKEEQR